MSRTSRTLRLTLMGLLLAMGAPGVQAQDVRIGVQAGPAFGFLSDSATPFSASIPQTNANLRLTPHGGVHLIVPLTDHLALQPELRLLQKGGHFSQPLSDRYIVERYRFSYLQGAVLLRPSVPLSGPLSLHLVAGLTVDRALSGEARRNYHSAELDVANRLSLRDSSRLRRWDIGGVLGAGIGYPVGTAGRAALTLRYNPGFRSVFVQSAHGSLSDRTPNNTFPLPQSLTSLRHDVITASLTYTAPLTSIF